MGAGAVGLTSKALEAIMLGKSLPQRRIKGLLRYVTGASGTPNQRYMAAAACLFADTAEVQAAAVFEIDRMLAREELEGPCPWELLCPDPHQGMYLLARVGVMAAGVNAEPGSPAASLGLRAAAVLGQEVRLSDLVVAPDGSRHGLPGTRAPSGPKLARLALTAVGTETRRRQGFDFVHRGTGGRKRVLKWDTEDSDVLVDGPACWLKEILDSSHGEALLDGPLSASAPLPRQLRLGLTVARWGSGTQAWLDDPGPEKRKQYIIHGSAAAKRDADRDEDPCTWIRVEWGAAGRHRVTAGESWETAPPEATGRFTRIEGLPLGSRRM